MRFAFAALALSLFAGPALAESPDTSGADKLGWKLTLQSWTAVQARQWPTKRSRIRSTSQANRFALHRNLSRPGVDQRRQGKIRPGNDRQGNRRNLDIAKAADVKIIDTGVIGISDSQRIRPARLFDWAKKMGITEIVSEPEERALPMIDKLAGEYHIKVAHARSSQAEPLLGSGIHLRTIKDLQEYRLLRRRGPLEAQRIGAVVGARANMARRFFRSHFKDLVPAAGSNGLARRSLGHRRKQGRRDAVDLEAKRVSRPDRDRIRIRLGRADAAEMRRLVFTSRPTAGEVMSAAMCE